jgi:OHCU decarboxylase
MSKSTFVEQFGGVYEHSAWVAEKAYDDGLPDGVEPMVTTLRTIIEAAGEAPQLTLLRAHPDLAGKLAKTGELTAESTSEQAGAGLDECTPEEFAEFTHLNDTYKTKFGFPYILAVKGRHRVEILDNFRSRVDNSTTQEFREALDQVHQIARLRLEAMTI